MTRRKFNTPSVRFISRKIGKFRGGSESSGNLGWGGFKTGYREDEILVNFLNDNSENGESDDERFKELEKHYGSYIGLDGNNPTRHRDFMSFRDYLVKVVDYDLSFFEDESRFGKFSSEL